MTLPFWAQYIIAAYLLFGTILAGFGIAVRQIHGLDRKNRYRNPAEVLQVLFKIATWPYGIYRAAKQAEKEINGE